MRKLIVATMMLCTSAAQAADWSPVFKTWSKGCYFNQSKIEKAIIKLSANYNDYGYWEVSNKVLTGDYSKIPLPYRNDMLPAYTEAIIDEPELEKVVIPLQNATFQGMPLKSYAFRIGDTVPRAELNVGKYTKAKERKLNILRKKWFYEVYQTVEVETNQKGELILYCDGAEPG